MKVYEIITEADIMPRLTQVDGRWGWNLPDGSRVGSFSSVQSAQQFAQNNPDKLKVSAPAGGPRPNAPQPGQQGFGQMAQDLEKSGKTSKSDAGKKQEKPKAEKPKLDNPKADPLEEIKKAEAKTQAKKDKIASQRINGFFGHKLIAALGVVYAGYDAITTWIHQMAAINAMRDDNYFDNLPNPDASVQAMRAQVTAVCMSKTLTNVAALAAMAAGTAKVVQFARMAMLGLPLAGWVASGLTTMGQYLILKLLNDEDVQHWIATQLMSIAWEPIDWVGQLGGFKGVGHVDQAIQRVEYVVKNPSELSGDARLKTGQGTQSAPATRPGPVAPAPAPAPGSDTTIRGDDLLRQLGS